MRNIGNIFKRDVQRFHKNVIAWIVILGITVVPALYAWFNIAASWDPYGNTKNLKVAVASVDKGYEGDLVPVTLNLGNNVLSALRENDQLDWTFTNQEKALDGVKSGKYYAAIVIPEDFSKNMMSLFSKNVTNPKITYYSNAKENAIAPKVTDKGASAIQTQVKEVFIETISNTAISAMQAVADTADAKGADSIAATLIANLEKNSQELNAASGTIQAFSSLTESTQKMLETTSAFLKQSEEHSDHSLDALEKTETSFSDMQGAISGATEGVNQALAESGDYYEQIAQTLQDTLSSLSSDTQGAADILDGLAGKAGTMADAYQSLADTLTPVLSQLGEEHPEIAPATGKIIGKLNESTAVQTTLKERLSKAAESVRNHEGGSSVSKEEMDELLRQSKQSIAEVKSDYEQNVKNNLESLYASLGDTKNSISGLLDQVDQSASGVYQLSGSASSDLTQVRETLETSSALLDKAATRLSATVDRLKKAQAAGDFQTLETIIGGDKDSITAFLSSPVNLATEKLYPVENYGSSMSPFYSVLAIWVGGIVLVAMLKVQVSEASLEGMTKVKNHQMYLGRYVLFLIIGLMQSGLICLGDLYYLEIQCKHPFLFLLAGWFTSIVFVNIIYTLTVSFGDIGKAVCVVLLVMQVAGSGGTFPIEVAPEFFQKVYPLLPFTHSMAAMRECIGGMYGMTYWRELGILGIFLLASLFLGLVLRTPIIKLNDAFTEKLESTHLI
ncbi:YhgE/Pip domain-containing protein [Faecalicatena sp. AGMB00832]|uniref:YhgE/Pip domain-containing protein n=1 Tax=Faecalicatena faecalis TaxID=2726362 RepID=A0ABS6D0T0_9FIRM|nr:YhgE/Pip domain-containing protein [Faecalicatena faecalis]MBU3875194.1 YhgE/Pip domain-containing protein [Faecalicatena faecalis]